LLRLALPVVLVQVGWMAMGVVDTMFVGRVSAVAMAAVALGNLYVLAATFFGAGVLIGLDPVVSQAVGARDREAVVRGVQRALVLTVPLALLGAAALLPAAPLLTAFRQPPEVVPLAAGFAIISIAGVLPFYVFMALRQSLQAMLRIAPIVYTILVANLANAACNWIFVFGHLGLPAMGALGSAWATTASRWVMAVLLLVLARRDLAPLLLPWRREAFAWRPLLAMLRLGVPIGVQLELELGVFSVVGLMMGWLGPVPMAGHQVALNIASVTFMVPLGVSIAAAVLVGQAVGRGDGAGARSAASAALVCGVGFMVASGALMLGVPGLFARVYTTDAGVAAVAVLLIPLAGLFQVFDGTQVVSIGVLRGTGDTRTPMIANILGFWLVGMPVSWWLGLRTPLGPRGLWLGLVVGLAVVAAFLVLRVRRRLAGEVSRVVIYTGYNRVAAKAIYNCPECFAKKEKTKSYNKPRLRSAGKEKKSNAR
jgi:MATE family multidrug resistance protein